MPISQSSAVTDQEESLSAINQNLLRLIAVSAVAGVLVGVIGGGFHWLLANGQTGFMQLIAQWRLTGVGGLPGWIAVMLIAGCSVGIARWLIRFAPSASGSGVQHVEAVMRGQDVPAPLIALPVKFVGGLLALIPGLALGREGPTIQMAAVIGSQCGRIFRLSDRDKSLLYNSVAGAGLAVAFNAPIAGVAFVIEEVLHRVNARHLLTTLVAVGTSIAVFHHLYGNQVAFDFSTPYIADATNLFAFALFGVVLGAAGVLYNKSILLGLNTFTRSGPTILPEIKAAMIGAAIGLLGYWQPFWVGGGESQIQTMLSQASGVNMLLTVLLVRWVLGPVSYAPGLPGGLFAPLLLIGACLGAIAAKAVGDLSQPLGLTDTGVFMLVGMAAFFTGVVRAPFTGVILIIEMSANVSLAPALMIASVSSAVTASLMRAEPIYDSLRARMANKKNPSTEC